MAPSLQRTEDSPRLSVVVPVYNDPDGIRTTLESLVTQTYPAERYEVIVVDNDSDDDTPEVVGEYCDRYPNLVTLLIEDEIQSSYAARNRGIEHARGSLVSFVDADMTVEPTWAESVVESAEAHDWDYMGCTIETHVVGDDSLTATYDRAMGFTVRRYLEEAHFTVTACLTVRKAVFDEVGGFDSRLISGGDGEFGERVHDAGLTQYFEPDITVYHPARTTLGAWLRKQFRVGRGAIQRRRYHSERAESSHPLDPRNFLPLRPLTFYTRLTDAMQPTAREAVALYGIGYLSKLARGAGGLFEQYFHE